MSSRATQATHPTRPRSARFPTKKQEGLSDGLKKALEEVAVLNVPHGLAEHNPAAALNAFQKELNKPLISVHAGVLHVNGVAVPSGTTLSIHQLIDSMKKSQRI